MTANLTELRRLLAEANATGAGPWREVDRGDFVSVAREDVDEDGDWSDDWPGELIVALLNAAPALLDELERLRSLADPPLPALLRASQYARCARRGHVCDLRAVRADRGGVRGGAAGAVPAGGRGAGGGGAAAGHRRALPHRAGRVHGRDVRGSARADRPGGGAMNYEEYNGPAFCHFCGPGVPATASDSRDNAVCLACAIRDDHKNGSLEDTDDGEEGDEA